MSSAILWIVSLALACSDREPCAPTLAASEIEVSEAISADNAWLWSADGAIATGRADVVDLRDAECRVFGLGGVRGLDIAGKVSK